MEMDYKDMIGCEVDILDDNCKAYKKVTIKDVFTNGKGEPLFEDTNGDIYKEEDINFTYRLTTGAILMLFLEKHGYISEEEAFDKPMSEYEDELSDLFGMLEKSGYLSKKED